MTKRTEDDNVLRDRQRVRVPMLKRRRRCDPQPDGFDVRFFLRFTLGRGEIVNYRRAVPSCATQSRLAIRCCEPRPRHGDRGPIACDQPGEPAVSRIAITRLASGELLALACSGRARHARARYRQRWIPAQAGIETMFGNLKTKGFALEAAHLTGPEQTVHVARAVRFRRGADGENRCRQGSPASHSNQKTRPPALVAVRARSAYALMS